MTNASSSQEIKQILKKGIEFEEKQFLKALVTSSEILLNPLQFMWSNQKLWNCFLRILNDIK